MKGYHDNREYGVMDRGNLVYLTYTRYQVRIAFVDGAGYCKANTATRSPLRMVSLLFLCTINTNEATAFTDMLLYPSEPLHSCLRRMLG